VVREGGGKNDISNGEIHQRVGKIERYTNIPKYWNTRKLKKPEA